MPKVKVLKGFIGSISGNHGQEIEIEDQKVIDDLVQAGFVQRLETNTPKKNHKKVVDSYENE